MRHRSLNWPPPYEASFTPEAFESMASCGTKDRAQGVLDVDQLERLIGLDAPDGRSSESSSVDPLRT